jgi:hypothetical protein
MDGELNEVSNELVRRHMGLCEECTLKFAALEEQEEQLAHALVHEPGEEFFDRFAAEVERLLPPETGRRRGASSPAARAAALRQARDTARDEADELAASPGPARPGPETDRRAAVERPMPEPVPDLSVAAGRHAASPTSETAGLSDASELPGAAGLSRASDISRTADPTQSGDLPAEDFPMGEDLEADETLAALSAGRTTPAARRPVTTPSHEKPLGQRNAPPPAPRSYAPERSAGSPPPRPRPVRRPPQRRPKISRPAPSIPWYAALALAAIAGAAGVVISRTPPVSGWLDSHGLDRPIQLSQSQDQPEPGAVERFLLRGSESRDPFAALPPTSLAQVREAQRVKAAADQTPTAAGYDAAADEWARAIPLLRGARQQSLARLEMASSRYRAWQNEPTDGRAAAAAAAIRDYLEFAPQGAPRELAKGWLAQVSP